ncbi:MAG: hypothetical protein JJU06_09990 [Ectothiorhodospiraceae bacterium]|nr:hypothetical protein [Ectothiorhodospiraceae bacterium]
MPGSVLIAALLAVGTAAADGLRLSGTLHDAAQPRALIGGGVGTESWLRPGDEAGVCRLEMVAADHVWLLCPAGRQRLALAASAEASRAAPEDGAQGRARTQEVFLDWPVLEALFLDRQRLVNTLTLVPESADGVLTGWRVERFEEDGPLAALQLAEGDLITAVNAIPVAQGSAVMEALKAAGQEQGLSVSVLRGGYELRLDYRFLIAAGE